MLYYATHTSLGLGCVHYTERLIVNICQTYAYALRGRALKEALKVLKVSKAAKGVSGLKVLKEHGRGAAIPSKAVLSYVASWILKSSQI